MVRASLLPRWLKWSVALALLSGGLADPASAQQVSPAPSAMNAQHRDENGESGRTQRDAVNLHFTYLSDLNADISGGERRGSNFLGRAGLIGDANLEQLLGWRGTTAHFSIHWIHGEGLSGHRVGNLLTVSGVEAKPALRLFNLWIEQRIGSRAALRIGQFTAAQEFAISPTAALFVNATFGWPASFAADLPSGGPAYPLAAPGLRLAFMAQHQLTLRAALFAGDPAGPGGGDPQRRDRHGFNGLRFSGKPFAIMEIARDWGNASNPAFALRLGAWHHFDRFAQITPPNVAEADALSRRAGNSGLYGIADGLLWQGGGHSLRAFVRATWSPPDPNLIDLYADAGLSLQSPFAKRPNDIAGLGFAYARISSRLRSLVGHVSAGLPGGERVIEASYQAQIAGSFSLQPNLQYVFDPAAGALAPTLGGSSKPIADALVSGLRTSLRF
jgi:porin